MQLQQIAHIQSGFPSKFGIPRQSNLVKGLQAVIVFEEGYRNPDALRGLESFSHIWLLWGFSETERKSWSPTVRPPRLGGNVRRGVFATRSPYRPNAVGLSSVRLERLEQHPALGPLIHVTGADLMDGTPIYDIKPYLPYTDCHPDATGGFSDEHPRLRVELPELYNLKPEVREVLAELLAQDPRPSYHDDPTRIYGMAFGELEVRFSVDGDLLTVREIIGRQGIG